MTKEEIIEYNKRCAKLLGYLNEVTDKDFYFVTKDDYQNNGYIPKLLELNFEKRFLNDWNWIIEVYDKLMRLPSLGDIKCPETGPLGIFTNIKYNIPDKEKTIQAINTFLIWYENK